MSWGKKKKHASQNTIPAAEFRQEGESALFEKAPKEPSKPAPGEYLDNRFPSQTTCPQRNELRF